MAQVRTERWGKPIAFWLMHLRNRMETQTQESTQACMQDSYERALDSASNVTKQRITKPSVQPAGGGGSDGESDSEVQSVRRPPEMVDDAAGSVSNPPRQESTLFAIIMLIRCS